MRKIMWLDKMKNNPVGTYFTSLNGPQGSKTTLSTLISSLEDVGPDFEKGGVTRRRRVPTRVEKRTKSKRRRRRGYSRDVSEWFWKG